MGKQKSNLDVIGQRAAQLQDLLNRQGAPADYYGLLTSLVREFDCKSVLELGTFRGASARAMLEGLGPDGCLTSIDLAATRLPASLIEDSRFHRVVGDSLVPDCFPSTPHGVDLLFIDTEHTFEQVSAEWELYRSALKPGAIVCFDDIHINEGMARFWDQLSIVKWDTGGRFHPSGFGVALNGPDYGRPERPSVPKRCVAILAHDDHEWFEPSIKSVKPFGEVFVFLNDRPWCGEPRDTGQIREIAEGHGAKVVDGMWVSEEDQRQKAYGYLRNLGFTHALIADTDEVYERQFIDHLVKVADHGLAERVYAEWDTYWYSPEYVVRPREPFTPCVMIDLFETFNVRLRDFEGGRPLFLGAAYGIVHHLSYCGSDKRIRDKVDGWSHHSDVVAGWWEKKWQGWKADRTLRDLHPTHPSHYECTERVRTPEVLQGAMAVTCGTIMVPPASNGKKLPSVSVCIPLYGGRTDIRQCLESLDACRDLVSEVIVVDNASPDKAADVVREFPSVKLVVNPENRGFARASNQAYGASSGDVVLFLNSDTVVSPHGLKALVEDLTSSGTIAAAGPVSNRVGHSQMIQATYQSLETMGLFAEDLAASQRETRDTDMLVGFCLAVKRSVLEEVGAFDESFGLGLFEDNDLCYRIRRAGYRLVVSERAFVHHKGSASFQRSDIDAAALLKGNQAVFEKKWVKDLETGFASALSGLAVSAIVFDNGRKPENLDKTFKKRAQTADVSLCMIVKDEERVIADCLKSAMPYFNQVIVVDTGSTDRTAEIARSLGAEVYVHPWEDSFSVARNHSLAYAKGKWVMWIDADDTLPVATGEAILEAAVAAPPNVHGFVVPVQFVEEGPGAGTRVDHVKLLRNLPGLAFEGRIHEQVLPSIRKHGGEIAHLGQIVLHSGYDTSDEGQAKKRKRDRKLLALDFFERPGHPFVLFNLGMTTHYLGQHRKAVRWLRRSIASARQGESHLRKAYDLMGVSLRQLDRPQDAEAVLRDGLKAVGEDAELRFHLALLCSSTGRNEEALEHYDQVLKYDPAGNFHSFDIGILGFKTLHNRGGVLLSLGRYEDAKNSYLQALAQAPTFLTSAFELFGAALENGDLNTAHDCIGRVAEQEGYSGHFADMVARHSLVASGLAGMIETLRNLSVNHPQEWPIRLRYAKALAENGLADEARPHLTELKHAGVAEAAYILAVSDLIQDDFQSGRRNMIEALRLNPGHSQTAEQLRAINRSLGLPEEEGVVQ